MTKPIDYTKVNEAATIEEQSAPTRVVDRVLPEPLIRDQRGPRIITGAPDIVTLPKAFKPEDITTDSLRTLTNESFPLWCLSSGVTVDGHKIDFNDHRYLIPIYSDPGQVVVWQKAAQLGATVYMLLRMVWWLKNHQGRSGALYFPTRDGADLMSSARLSPMISSVPELQQLMGEAAQGNFKDRNSLRRIGDSLFYVFHLGGKASKDSTPLDYISFDEVRLCKSEDIDQAMERISHSSHKMRVLMSTAGLPDRDIAQRFNGGTQHIFMTKCGCPDGCDLARTFPECVVPDDPRRDGPYLRCPKCRYEIKDRRNGRYIPRNPGADYTSYHVSQLNSWFISTKEIWDFYKRTTNIPEFYNSKLGLPYVDEENLPITDEVLRNSVADFPWAEAGETPRTAMGIDQMGQFNYVVIADYSPDGGYKRIRHLEIIESDNPEYMEAGKKVSPFKRCYELMQEYNVRVCVVDAMPNVNEAMDFARAFPGRVFIGWYQKNAKDVVQWGDRPQAKVSIRKAGPLLRFKHHAIMGMYTSIDFALNEFVQGNVKVPNPRGIVQYVRSETTGMFNSEYICESRFFHHLTKIVRNKHILNDETGEFRMEWIPLGLDPHFVHAWTYCNVALERLRRVPQMIFA